VTGSTALGLAAALGSALALNWGYWAQHGAAAALPPLSLRAPLRSLRLLFTHPRWAVGFVVGLGGWVLYVAALRVAPLSLVQAVSAGGIGILALLAWRFGGTRPARRELIALALALFGLAALALSLVSSSPHSRHGSLVAVAVWVGCSAVVAAAIVGTGTRFVRAGAVFGVASGCLYAAGDVATKAAVGGGARLALIAVLLACHGLAFVALQLGFQRGGVLATAGLASLFTNAVPIVAGLVLFGEGLPSGWPGIVRLIGFAAVVVGGAGLARGEAPATGVHRTPVEALPA
jgi:drug/metabolite transporter (DMT)-like permease